MTLKPSQASNERGYLSRTGRGPLATETGKSHPQVQRDLVKQVTGYIISVPTFSLSMTASTAALTQAHAIIIDSAPSQLTLYRR